jgi:hypothetical protein
VNDRHHADPASPPGRGFVRPDLYILAAILGLALAVVVPQAVKHGLKGALVALGGLVLVVAACLGALFLATWLLEGRGLFQRGAGHLARFLLFGLMASAVGSALVVWHGLSPAVENGVALASGLLGGGSGCLLHHHLGPSRFWSFFGRLCLALLGSLVGGLLGILLLGSWGVTLGVLVPLLLFALLTVAGRTVPASGG